MDPANQTAQLHILRDGNDGAASPSRAGNTLGCLLFPGVTTGVARIVA